MMRLRYITRGHEVRQVDVDFFRYHADELPHTAVARFEGRVLHIPHGSLVDAYWPREPERGDDG